MQASEEQPVENPGLTCLNFLCIYITEASIGVAVTGAGFFFGWLGGSMTYSCDQYLGYPVGPSPANDLTVPPNATTCPPQLNSNSSYICFKPKCEQNMRIGEEIGSLVGAGVTATVLAATGLFQAGYVLRRRLSRATNSEKTPILPVNASTPATEGRVDAPPRSRQNRTDSRALAL